MDAAAAASRTPTPLLSQPNGSGVVVRANKPRKRRIISRGSAARDAAWEERVFALLGRHILAQCMQAWISTIGGACFALRRHKSALAIAKKQEGLGALMSNSHSMRVAKLHQVYNLLGLGRRRAAARALQSIEAEAAREQDQVVLGMCENARRRMKTQQDRGEGKKEEREKEAKEEGGKGGEGGEE